MVNDRGSIMCNTRWFSNQLCKTVFAVESGPLQHVLLEVTGILKSPSMNISGN